MRSAGVRRTDAGLEGRVRKMADDVTESPIVDDKEWMSLSKAAEWLSATMAPISEADLLAAGERGEFEVYDFLGEEPRVRRDDLIDVLSRQRGPDPSRLSEGKLRRLDDFAREAALFVLRDQDYDAMTPAEVEALMTSERLRHLSGDQVRQTVSDRLTDAGPIARRSYRDAFQRAGDHSTILERREIEEEADRIYNERVAHVRWQVALKVLRGELYLVYCIYHGIDPDTGKSTTPCKKVPFEVIRGKLRDHGAEMAEEPNTQEMVARWNAAKSRANALWLQGSVSTFAKLDETRALWGLDPEMDADVLGILKDRLLRSRGVALASEDARSLARRAAAGDQIRPKDTGGP